MLLIWSCEASGSLSESKLKHGANIYESYGLWAKILDLLKLDVSHRMKLVNRSGVSG